MHFSMYIHSEGSVKFDRHPFFIPWVFLSIVHFNTLIQVAILISGEVVVQLLILRSGDQLWVYGLVC